MKIQIPWMRHKKEYEVPLDGSALVEVYVTSDKPVQLVECGVPIKTGSEFYCRRVLTAPVKLVGAEFGAKVSFATREEGEPFDDRPLPPPPGEANLLQAMRTRFRNEMQVNREMFLESEARPSYELDEDEPDAFEEDIIEAHNRASDKKGSANEGSSGSDDKATADAKDSGGDSVADNSVGDGN